MLTKTDESVIKILVVEDDLVEYTHLEILLNQLGHQVVAHADNALDAILAFNKETPDLIIADISIRGELDGIQLIHKLNEIDKVPVVFLTSHNQSDTFNKAKETQPFAYMIKPVEPSTLERSIELAFRNFSDSKPHKEWKEEILVKDCFFIKIGNRLKKIPIADIHFIEVEGKYCSINVADRKYHVKIALKDMLLKLPMSEFVRVSRNFIVNVSRIDNIDTQNFQVVVGTHEIPISRTYKEDLLKRIHLI